MASKQKYTNLTSKNTSNSCLICFTILQFLSLRPLFQGLLLTNWGWASCSVWSPPSLILSSLSLSLSVCSVSPVSLLDFCYISSLFDLPLPDPLITFTLNFTFLRLLCFLFSIFATFHHFHLYLQQLSLFWLSNVSFIFFFRVSIMQSMSNFF